MIRKEKYPIVGMHCASCKALIERTLRNAEGISTANINYGTETLLLEFDDSKISLDEISKKISNLGTYELITTTQEETVLASPPKKKQIVAERKAAELSTLKNNLLFVGFASLPFMLLMVWMLVAAIFVGTPMLSMYVDHTLLNLSQFVLATPILFWGGRSIHKSTFQALRVGAFNMDSLITLGTFTAWIYSTLVTFLPTFLSTGISIGNGEVYFEASVFIIFFILLGRYLEANAKSKTNDAIKSLLKLQAKEATVLREGIELTIPLEEVLVGDTVLIKPGTKIPIDGIVLEGSTTIDESMITGESLPVEKSVDSNVVGATINRSGFIKVRATKVGSETMLSQIIKMVEDAQATEAPIQKLADKVASVFVPIVILVALVTFLVWVFFADISMAVYAATTVLIIACPCALGLATPTAIMVGTGNAAKQGILIRDAKALEISNKITHIVFDKTGTLTEGAPKVQDIKTFGTNSVSSEFAEQLLFSLERKSAHPLAESIVSHFNEKIEKELDIMHFEDVPGRGVKGTVSGEAVCAGNLKFMKENNVSLSDELFDFATSLEEKANTVIYLGYAGVAVLAVGIADSIKGNAAKTITALRDLGIETYLLTGDNKQTAKVVGESLGITNILAEVLPQDKASQIKALQESNSTAVVAMVGDGINDAPALAQAHVGVAMGTGTDIAIESADIVLVGGNVFKVVDALQVSRTTVSTIKQNLFWAFGYNTLGIPIAAGVLYPFFGIMLSPIIASFAMAMSSVSVVGNSLRLKNKQF